MYHVNPYAKSLHAMSGLPDFSPLQPKPVTADLYLKQAVKPVDTSLYLKPKTSPMTPFGPLTAQQQAFQPQGLGPLQQAPQHTFDAQGLGPLQIAQDSGDQPQAVAQGNAAVSPMNSYPLYLNQQVQEQEQGSRFPSHYVPVNAKPAGGAGLLALLGGLALLAMNKR